MLKYTVVELKYEISSFQLMQSKTWQFIEFWGSMINDDFFFIRDKQIAALTKSQQAYNVGKNAHKKEMERLRKDIGSR